MLMCATLTIGCVSDSDNNLNTPASIFVKYPGEGAVVSTPELTTEVTKVYETAGGYTKVVYTIENVGDIPVTRLQVSVYLKDDMDKITAIETCYPSNYPDYGLKPGQILYAERLFNEDESIGYVSGGVIIVNYDV